MAALPSSARKPPRPEGAPKPVPPERERVDGLRFERDTRLLVKKLHKETQLKDRTVFGVNLSAKRRWRHDMIHYLNPLQREKDAHAALLIQKYWHRYRIRVRKHFDMLKRRREGKAGRKKRRMKAVLDVQRVYRGKVGRMIARHVVNALFVIKIQKIWRG